MPRRSRSSHDYLEERFELADDVKAKLDESRREIAAGNYTTRQLQ